MSSPEFSRRDALGLAAGAALLGPLGAHRSEASTREPGRLNHSVCRWCYGGISLEDLCKQAKAMGIASVELLSENEWATAKANGMRCAIANGPGGITDGWNTVANHDRLVHGAERLLPLVAEAGIPQMIVFSGNRRGMSDPEGLENCAKGLKRIMPIAEKHGVTVIMELLNSRVDHGDYQCDRTPWGVELVKRVESDRFRLLYDIYHMQIMEGDVIRTIERNKDFIAHYHTGGNPGRAEIDETQELNYRRIAQAIADTGFKGFVAQEFIPRKDPMTSLKRAIEICTV
ncbi:MAG: TIM barrel protein [Nitrospirae bacterium]|nr:TIM barrel protein [Fimbriimonadaceae bacterium]